MEDSKLTTWEAPDWLSFAKESGVTHGLIFPPPEYQNFIQEIEVWYNLRPRVNGRVQAPNEQEPVENEDSEEDEDEANEPLAVQEDPEDVEEQPDPRSDDDDDYSWTSEEIRIQREADEEYFRNMEMIGRAPPTPPPPPIYFRGINIQGMNRDELIRTFNYNSPTTNELRQRALRRTILRAQARRSREELTQNLLDNRFRVLMSGTQDRQELISELGMVNPERLQNILDRTPPRARAPTPGIPRRVSQQYDLGVYTFQVRGDENFYYNGIRVGPPVNRRIGDRIPYPPLPWTLRSAEALRIRNPDVASIERPISRNNRHGVQLSEEILNRINVSNVGGGSRWPQGYVPNINDPRAMVFPENRVNEINQLEEQEDGSENGEEGKAKCK